MAHTPTHGTHTQTTHTTNLGDTILGVLVESGFTCPTAAFLRESSGWISPWDLSLERALRTKKLDKCCIRHLSSEFPCILVYYSHGELLQERQMTISASPVFSNILIMGFLPTPIKLIDFEWNFCFLEHTLGNADPWCEKLTMRWRKNLHSKREGNAGNLRTQIPQGVWCPLYRVCDVTLSWHEEP